MPAVFTPNCLNADGSLAALPSSPLATPNLPLLLCIADWGMYNMLHTMSATMASSQIYGINADGSLKTLFNQNSTDFGIVSFIYNDKQFKPQFGYVADFNLNNVVPILNSTTTHAHLLNPAVYKLNAGRITDLLDDFDHKLVSVADQTGQAVYAIARNDDGTLKPNPVKTDVGMGTQTMARWQNTLYLTTLERDIRAYTIGADGSLTLQQTLPVTGGAWRMTTVKGN